MVISHGCHQLVVEPGIYGGGLTGTTGDRNRIGKVIGLDDADHVGAILCNVKAARGIEGGTCARNRGVRGGPPSPL